MLHFLCSCEACAYSSCPCYSLMLLLSQELSFSLSYNTSSILLKIDNIIHYGKCSKISHTFLFLFSNKMLVFRVAIHKMDRF